MLLTLLLQHFDRGKEPLVFGIDETIERRWGRSIKARGIYRDAVRSSGSHFVKASGLRWISLMWLAYIPWAARVWALPILTALAPSARYYADKPRAPKTLLAWARQLVLQLRRWLPGREMVLVADNSYAALEFLHACQSLAKPVTVVTRLRIDASPVSTRAAKVLVCQRCRPGWMTPKRPGRKSRLTGITMLSHATSATTRNARLKLQLAQRSGTQSRRLDAVTVACPLYRCVGCSSATLRPNSSRKRCCAPTAGLTCCRSAPGSCNAGNSKLHSRKYAPTSVLKHSTSGRMPRSRA